MVCIVRVHGVERTPRTSSEGQNWCIFLTPRSGIRCEGTCNSSFFLGNSLKAYNHFIYVPATTPTLSVYQKQRFPLSMTSSEPLFVGSRGDSGVKCRTGTEEEDLSTVTSWKVRGNFSVAECSRRPLLKHPRSVDTRWLELRSRFQEEH